MRSWLAKLEARCATAAAITRSGIVVRLADGFLGERHIVIVSRRVVNASPTAEWCHFEERPGPGANEAARAKVIYLSQTDAKI